MSMLCKNEAASAHCCDDKGRTLIDAMAGTELPAAAPKPLSQSTEALFRADEAGAILWQWTPKAHRSEPNRTNRRLAKVLPRKTGLVSFGFKLLLAKAPAKGRLSNIVGNLCVEGKPDFRVQISDTHAQAAPGFFKFHLK